MLSKEQAVKILAENIRIERARKRLSQEYLAEKADITPQHLYRIENEKVSPTIHVVANIALALGVDLNCLLPLE
ncbi:MAG: helix-turn-helix transcriptional regulator [bacterium]|nr:helix-turn-helix transcriptional regulator [bacterium]